MEQKWYVRFYCEHCQQILEAEIPLDVDSHSRKDFANYVFITHLTQCYNCNWEHIENHIPLSGVNFEFEFK